MDTQEIKVILKAGRIALILLAAFLAVLIIGAIKDLRENSPSYNSITVSGEGEVFAVPDVASFTFSVSAEAKDVADAQNDVTEKMDKVLDALKGMGIDEKDIKTSDYTVYPKYTYTQAPCSVNYCPPSNPVQDGYTASHSVTVKVRDTDKAGEALGVAGENGATNLSGINFTIDDPEALKSEARAMAIEDAKAKAEVLSDELDVKIVRVVSFYDSTDNPPMPYYGRAESSVGMGGADVAKVATPSLPTGENRVKVVVNVTYEIR